MSLLVFDDRDPLNGKSKDEFVDLLKVKLRNRVLAAYLFGSITKNDLSFDSDIDLILVTPTEKSFFERALDFRDLFEIAPALDLLIYTPEEFANNTNDPSVGFWQDVVATMERII